MTRSTGASGLILSGSPFSAFIASRMAARSTTAGTPVKSCISTRAGRKAISRSEVLFFSQSATARMSSALTVCPSSCRKRFSSKHLQRKGQARDAGEPVLLGRRQAEINVGLSADGEFFSGFETVEARHGIVLVVGGADGAPELSLSAWRFAIARPTIPSRSAPYSCHDPVDNRRTGDGCFNPGCTAQ